MRAADLLHRKRNEILRIAAAHGALDVQVFGSAASGEDRAGSDIDLLVRPGPTTSAWFPVGLIEDLEALLGRKVDVVTENALHRTIRDQILREARSL
jgi:predicted nucleotidyltransferase